MKNMIGGLMIAGLTLTGCATQSDQSRQVAAVMANKVFDLAQARQELIGKTPEELNQILGAPDHEAGKGQWLWWTYEGKFHDSLTHKILDEVTLVIQNGKVLDINY